MSQRAGLAAARRAVLAAAPAMAASAAPRAGGGGLRWVLDPDDDVGCVRALTALHDLAAGRLVCHPSPGASRSVLVGDLLRLLGKHRDALAREKRTRHGPALLRVWLRAEGIRHLVVLRAHRLRPALLDELAALAATAEVTVWLVWHRRDTPPPRPTCSAGALSWPAAAAVLRADPGLTRAGPTAEAGHLDRAYHSALAAARREAARWRDDPPPARPRRFVHPGCAVAAVIQRLTIDAATRTELQARLHAARAGFAAEGVQLRLPAPTAPALAALGPRLSPTTVTRLRRLACPTSAAALMLALAADADVACLTECAPHLASAEGSTIRMLAGTYRIPPRARPLLRAAVVAHHDRGVRAHSLLVGPDGDRIGRQRMAHLIARAAQLAGLEVPHAVVQSGTGIHQAAPVERQENDSG